VKVLAKVVERTRGRGRFSCGEGVIEAVAPVQAGPPGRIDVQECVMMKIFEMKVEGDRLVVMVDLSKKFGESKTGKSITIASTEGNVSVPRREGVKIGVNVYRKK